MLPGKELFKGCCMKMDIPAKVKLLPGDTCTTSYHFLTTSWSCKITTVN